MKKVIVLAVMMVALFAGATDRFYIEELLMMPGETRSVSIMLDNEEAYTAFQCVLYLPNGFTATNFALTSRKNSNHTLTVSTQPDGSMRLLSYSLMLKTYSSNSGALVTFDVTASEDFTGTATMNLRNTVFTTEDGVENDLADEECTVIKGQKGDVNGDGVIDITDVTALISKALENDVTPFISIAADLNNDGLFDITDVTMLISLVLSQP